MNALIIEDERKAAIELKRLLEEIRPEITIAAVLTSIEESLTWLDGNPLPDLIFSDIQLADGLSFDIFMERKIAVPVIFCTAFDEYAIRSFEANGIDYLLKPIEKSKLKRSLEKYDHLQNFFGVKPQESNLQSVITQLTRRYYTTLLIRQKEKIIPVKTETIGYFHYEEGVVYAYSGNQKYYIDHTLDELEQSLDPFAFFRANRQFIINRSSVVNAEYYFARKLVIRLTTAVPEPVVVSKAKASSFIRWLKS